MPNTEHLRNQPEAAANGFSTMRARMKDMLRGATEAVGDIRNTAAESLLLTAEWLQQNRFKIGGLISMLALTGCANGYGESGVSLAEITKQVNDLRAGAPTVTMSDSELADLQAAITATATPKASPTPRPTTRPTNTPTRQIRPTATATPRPTATATEAPKPTETPVTVTLIEVPAGVNVRQDHSTSAAVEFNTQGDLRLEATGEEYSDGTYTWYEVVNPEEPPETVWVASVNGVKKVTETLTIGTGGPVETDQETTNMEISNPQELATASDELGVEIAKIEDRGGVLTAYTGSGLIAGTKLPGQDWKAAGLPSVETSTEQTEMEGGAEITAQSISYSEALQQFPEAFSQEKLSNGNLTYVKSEGGRGVVTEYAATDMSYQVSNGILQMVDREGKVVFEYFDKNKDPELNGWAQTMFVSEGGRATISLLQTYNDPNYHLRDRWRDDTFRAIHGIRGGTPEDSLNPTDPSELEYFVNSPSMEQYFIEHGYMKIDTENMIVTGEEALTRMTETTFDLLKNATGQNSEIITVKMLDNTTQQLNTNLPVKIVIGSYAGSLGYYANEHFEAQKGTLPAQPVQVVDGQLLMYITNYDAASFILGNAIAGNFSRLLEANGGTPDEIVTGVFNSERNANNYKEGKFPEISQYVVQFYIDSSGRRIMYMSLQVESSDSVTGPTQRNS